MRVEHPLVLLHEAYDSRGIDRPAYGCGGPPGGGQEHVVGANRHRLAVFDGRMHEINVPVPRHLVGGEYRTEVRRIGRVRACHDANRRIEALRHLGRHN